MLDFYGQRVTSEDGITVSVIDESTDRLNALAGVVRVALDRGYARFSGLRLHRKPDSTSSLRFEVCAASQAAVACLCRLLMRPPPPRRLQGERRRTPSQGCVGERAARWLWSRPVLAHERRIRLGSVPAVSQRHLPGHNQCVATPCTREFLELTHWCYERSVSKRPV